MAGMSLTYYIIKLTPDKAKLEDILQKNQPGLSVKKFKNSGTAPFDWKPKRVTH
jgi:hypothetical protein